MESLHDPHTLRALLDWQIELGATEAIGDSAINRYAAANSAPVPGAPGATATTAPATTAPDEAEVSDRSAPVTRAAAPSEPPDPADPVTAARTAAQAATGLDALRAAIGAYRHCDLHRGAQSLVFADGRPGARVMIVGEAPGRDEDRAGLPFVGRAGQLLDRMFACIGLDRRAGTVAQALYITNVLPWRPPQNRDPEPGEIAMFTPFVARHVALADPDLIVLMGNVSCVAALGQRGITRLRGQWAEAWGKPALPMCHPAYLLRNPAAKREAWADLLALQARLRQTA